MLPDAVQQGAFAVKVNRADFQFQAPETSRKFCVNLLAHKGFGSHPNQSVYFHARRAPAERRIEQHPFAAVLQVQPSRFKTESHGRKGRANLLRNSIFLKVQTSVYLRTNPL